MKKIIFKLLALLILVIFSNCDNSKTIDYKYIENPNPLACDYECGDLYKEAVFSFENDIINTYDPKFKNPAKSYSSFINYRLRGTMKVKDVASEHSLKIAKALKKDNSIWTTSNGLTVINKSHPLVDCIANNIKDKDIKATFNSLLATNSLKPSLILPLLSNSSRYIQADGSLKSYVALELFYSQLLDVELKDLKNPNPQPEPAKPSVNGFNTNKTPKPAVPAKS
ncbi:MAG: hypothetical protein QNK89_08255 [Lacinutrix sp.]|uniref:hypothetical protein n=1 Tax=Lacinutrix sp. TaxID=1937692 RepID=UPI00309901A7